MLTDEQKSFFKKPNFGHLATLNADGSPHVSPVWIDVDDEHILINTAEGRKKLRNVRRDPRVAMEVHEQENPYSILSLNGEVVAITADGADEHIDELSLRYLGKEKYPFAQADEERIILKIRPTKVIAP
ncbi:MAG: PPOX class F420-dependent oxidoreductase [Actinobacteria bacterium]|nr:PPOX class F420-dependent oxidoreductase [Actinomycetota bacterium]